MPPPLSSRLVAALVLGQLGVHSAMAGLRLAAPLQILREGASAAAVGLLLALFAAAPVAVALKAGRLADRHGYHRPVHWAVFLTGLGALTAVASTWFSGVQNLAALASAALLTGAGANIGLIAIQRTAGLAARDAAERLRIFSWLGAAPSLANVVGPVLVGFLIDAGGFRAAYGALVALPLMTLLASRLIPAAALAAAQGPSSALTAGTALAGAATGPNQAAGKVGEMGDGERPEIPDGGKITAAAAAAAAATATATATAAAPASASASAPASASASAPASPPARTSAWSLMQVPGMKRLLFVNWLLSVCWDVHSFAVPILGHGLGFTASTIGLILGSFTLTVSVVRVLIPLLTVRLRELTVVRSAMLGTALVFAVYPLAQTPLSMGSLAVLLGLTLGGVQPMIMATLHRITPDGRHGESLAFRSMTLNASSALMPLLFGLTGVALGAAALFWAAGAAVGAGAWAARRLPSNDKA